MHDVLERLKGLNRNYPVIRGESFCHFHVDQQNRIESDPQYQITKKELRKIEGLFEKVIIELGRIKMRMGENDEENADGEESPMEHEDDIYG
jgi:hypothetical protein